MDARTILLLALSLICASQSPVPVDAPLGAEQRGRVIDDALQALNEQYVFPDVAKEMTKEIGSRRAKKEYDSITSSSEFARKLTEDLQAVCHDKHVRVRFNGSTPPTHGSGGGPGGGPGPMQQRMRETNFGFEKLERLPGNVGYLDLRAFAPVDLAAELASSSMTLLANSDALIIDLRANGGGSPEMVQYLCSYFFDGEPVHLNDLYFRVENETRQFWTLGYVPGKRYLDKPIYLLTSSKTFSGAEEFAYDLQNQKRATIVGETTGGGANPGGSVGIAAGFEVFVPMGRAINPVTKTNWEGKGVEPEVKCKAEEALGRAHKLALQSLLEKAEGPRKQALEQALAALK